MSKEQHFSCKKQMFSTEVFLHLRNNGGNEVVKRCMRLKEEYITLLRSYFYNRAKSYGVVRMALFGSVARGEQVESSDVDVAYEGKADILLRCRMKRELELLFGCKVDVVRLRKQMEGSVFQQKISKDLIYV